MKPYFAMGLFALYVVIVSLLRVMGQEWPRMAAVKNIWDRTRGLAIHFVACVALPMVLGIVFLTRGVAGFGAGEAPLFTPVHHQAALTHLHHRPAGEPVFITPGESIRTGEIPILLAALPPRAAGGPRFLDVDLPYGIP